MRIGVDEAGRGPAIGPLVVCAFQTSINQINRLAEIGVDDSKLLTPKQRNNIAEQLKVGTVQELWSYNIIVASAERIDRVMAIENLNDLEVTLFAEAISGLNHRPTVAIKSDHSGPAGITTSENSSPKTLDSKESSDQQVGVLSLDACDVNEERFGNRVFALLQPDWQHWAVKSKHGMDAIDRVVGAASILAKVKRDQIIAGISSEIGFDIGSGYPSDPKTIAAIPRLIQGATPHEQCRWGWKTICRAWSAQYGGQPPNRPAPNDGRIGKQTTLDFHQINKKTEEKTESE